MGCAFADVVFMHFWIMSDTFPGRQKVARFGLGFQNMAVVQDSFKFHSCSKYSIVTQKIRCCESRATSGLDTWNYAGFGG